MSSKEAWPVSIGSYSDYQVVAVCDTEEAAERLAAHLNEGAAQYAEQYAVDSPIDYYTANDPLPERVTTWSCTVYPDGRVVHRSEDKWPHEVSQGGSKGYGGWGHAHGYPTAEEAERAARGWASL